jgi:hypothetical protein
VRVLDAYARPTVQKTRGINANALPSRAWTQPTQPCWRKFAAETLERRMQPDPRYRSADRSRRSRMIEVPNTGWLWPVVALQPLLNLGPARAMDA